MLNHFSHFQLAEADAARPYVVTLHIGKK
ncbi:hypothetical protein BLAT2472_130118 [Burkholderia latens]